MLKEVTLFLLVCAIWSGVALADVSPNTAEPNKNDSSCSKHVMCEASTTTGVCLRTPSGGSADEIVGKFQGFKSAHFLSVESASATYSCDVYGNANGWDLPVGSGSLGSKAKLNTTSITETTPSLVLLGNYDYTWIECSANSGEGVTITALMCR